MPADWWLNALGGAVPLLIPVISAGVWRAPWVCLRLYQVQVSDRMHQREVAARVGMQQARLDMAHKLAEAGVAAVVGYETVVVVPRGSPATVDELLQAATGSSLTAPPAAPLTALPGAEPPTVVAEGDAPTDRGPP